MKIIFEDEHLIALEKPQNCPTQKDATRTRSLMEQLDDYFTYNCGIDDPYIGLVHRLDRHTGGIVVFAKTPNATRDLNALFSNHKLTKRYTAIVEGHFDQKQGRCINYLLSDTAKNITKIVPRNTPGSKYAELTYEVLGQFEHDHGPYSHVEITLLTGRQHQIRLQMSSIGHPVLFDEKYGATWPLSEKQSMTLWASALDFKVYVKKYVLRSTPPFAAYMSHK